MVGKLSVFALDDVARSIIGISACRLRILQQQNFINFMEKLKSFIDQQKLCIFELQIYKTKKGSVKIFISSVNRMSEHIKK